MDGSLSITPLVTPPPRPRYKKFMRLRRLNPHCVEVDAATGFSTYLFCEIKIHSV